jgi:hypothetical protein
VACPPTIKKIIPNSEGGFDEVTAMLESVADVDESETTSEEITGETTATDLKFQTCTIKVPNTSGVVEFLFPPDLNCPPLVVKTPAH